MSHHYWLLTGAAISPLLTLVAIHWGGRLVDAWKMRRYRRDLERVMRDIQASFLSLERGAGAGGVICRCRRFARCWSCILRDGLTTTRRSMTCGGEWRLCREC